MSGNSYYPSMAQFIWKEPGKLELQCTNDVSLMDSFMMHLPHLPPKTLKRLNACCIFLQVITLADITDGSGTHILPSSLQGIRHNDMRSSYMWPHQIRPSPEAWRVWRKTLCTQFCTTSASNRLLRPLGIWQHNGPLHQKWTFFVDLSSNHLFQQLAATGTFLRFLPAHSPRVFHSKARITFSCPSSLVPVTVAHRTSQFIELTARPLHSHRYIHPQTGTPSSCLPTPLSISGYLKSLPKDLSAALRHCYFPPNTSELVAEFHNQTLFVASNGSVCINGATLAWILYGTQTKIRAYGHGTVPGGGQPLTLVLAEVGG